MRDGRGGWARLGRDVRDGVRSLVRSGRSARGRSPGDADRPDTRPVVIVSEAMARRFWTDGDAVGRLVRRRDPDSPWLVVGVASDANVRQLGEPPRDMVYLPYSQRFTPSLTVVARTSVDPERTVLALLTAGRELDPDLRVVETKTMDRHLALMRLPQQLSAFVLSAFGVLALALAAVGLWGVVSYGVARRTREIARRSCFLPAVRGAWVRRRSASTAVAAARFRGRLAAAPSPARRREHPPARPCLKSASWNLQENFRLVATGFIVMFTGRKLAGVFTPRSWHRRGGTGDNGGIGSAA